MLIFAHRGLKLEHLENTMPAFKAASELGFGIELDVRLIKDEQLVCAHDAVSELGSLTMFEDVAKEVISLFGQQQKAALHLKYDEQGDEQLERLVHAFSKYNLYDKAFVFDLTFDTAEKLRRMDSGIQLAVSVGEENYAPTIYTWEQAQDHLNVFDIVWWDEWKKSGSVYNEEMKKAIHKAGKPIYAISPELHLDHGHPHAESGYEQDWKDFIKWSIEGVCTAYPREFEKLL